MSKVFYKREGGKFRKVNSFEFPSQPADGIWLVRYDKNCRSKSLIVKLSDLPKTIDISDKIKLSALREDIADIIMNQDKPISNMERADNIIDFICKKIREGKNEKI